MSDPSFTSTIPRIPNGTSAKAPEPCAVLVLDSRGRITAANTSARNFWQAGENGLAGEHFASLFAFEIVSNDPEFLDAQWDGMLATALDRPTSLTAQPREGAPREMWVRLEKTIDPTPGYIATVQPPPAATPAIGPDADGSAAGPIQILSEEGIVGFFDLNLKAGRFHYSPAWKKLLGYAAAELPDTLETWHALIHPDDSGAAPDKLARKAKPGARPFNVEFRMKHQRGHWAWIQCLGVQMVTGAGELERVVGLHLDIAERKELEDGLIASDARL
ncbi:MAG: PAS domain-containing protein, partial [Opitutus sp.]